MTATLTDDVTAIDLFSGCGGSSTGAERAGVKIVVAANHWPTALAVHAIHHPDARHDCADISQADPRRYPVTDILIASPECTNHSQAKGVTRKKQDPSFFDSADLAAERSRATMWDVPRFVEQIPYKAVVVENVVEATQWSGWRHWWGWMEDLGYTGKVLSINSQDHGVAQSRDRIYVVWVRKGIKIDLEMERTAWCMRCERHSTVRQAWKNGKTVGRYKTQWLWACIACGGICEPDKQPASSIIDWSLPCPKIGERDKKLADNTLRRIAAGLEKFGWTEPFTTAGAGNTYESKPGNRSRSIDQPVATQTCSGGSALAIPDDSLIVPMRNNGNAYRPTQPLGTVTAGVNHHGLLMRNNSGGAEMTTSVNEPARTMTTAGHQSLLLPYYSSSGCAPVDQPIGTQTTRDTHALIDVKKVVDECGFRMLKAYEVAAAMAFPKGYIPLDLTRTDQLKLAGNAVTPPVMTWICGRILQALEVAA